MIQRQRTRVWLPHLRAWRTWALLTQAQLADGAGISAGTIIRIENAHGMANVHTVQVLSTALGITPQQLVFAQPPNYPAIEDATSVWVDVRAASDIEALSPSPI